MAYWGALPKGHKNNTSVGWHKDHDKATPDYFKDRSHVSTHTHTKSLNSFKMTEIISAIFSDHNGMKLEIDYKRKPGKYTKKKGG